MKTLLNLHSFNIFIVQRYTVSLIIKQLTAYSMFIEHNDNNCNSHFKYCNYIVIMYIWLYNQPKNPSSSHVVPFSLYTSTVSPRNQVPRIHIPVHTHCYTFLF